MPGKISIPNTSALNDGSLSFGAIVFLQSVEDGLKTIDNNVVYKDAISAPTIPTTIKAISAQGVTGTVSNVSVASGADYVVLVNDVKALLQSYTQLQQVVSNLVKEIRGK